MTEPRTLQEAYNDLVTITTFDAVGWKPSFDEKGLYLESSEKKIMVCSERDINIYNSWNSFLMFRVGQIGSEGEIYQSHAITVPDDDYIFNFCNKCWYETLPYKPWNQYTRQGVKTSEKDPCPQCGNPHFHFHYCSVPREYVEGKKLVKD